MSHNDFFIPTGTLRHRFEPAEPDAAHASLDALLRAISQIAGDEYFDPALVWTAKYLVSTEPGLDPDTATNATLCALSFLVAIGEGSTRVPIVLEHDSSGEPGEPIDYLDTILGRFEDALKKKATLEPPPNGAEKLAAAARAIAEIRASRPAKTLSSDSLPTLLARVDADKADTEIPYRPLLMAGSAQNPALTSERMLRKEDAVARSIHARMSTDSDAPGELEKAVAELLAHPTRYQIDGGWKPQAFNFEQAHATLLAATSPLAFVTGGPGTGKTTIVVAILRLLMRLGYRPADIALAAPTGKAAYRMRESAIEQLNSLAALDAQPAPNDLGSLAADGADAMPPSDRALLRNLPEARTLHRLLEYSPGRDRFWRNEQNPLDAKIVICDEASMIDLGMMHALIDALPADAHLVLVGDADQLPPIGGGAPFRDLIASKSSPAPAWEPLIKKLCRDQAPYDLETPDTLAADGPMPSLPAQITAADPMSRFTARLKQSYRMVAGDADGGQILRLAHQVRDCKTADDPALKKFLKRTITTDAFAHLGGVSTLTRDTELADFAAAWFDRFCAFKQGEAPFHAEFNIEDGEFSEASTRALKRVFDHHARARILCLTQIHETGARAINRQMHELFKKNAREWPQKLQSDAGMMHLEPVMVTRNNYDLNLFNGDQGIIAVVHQKGHKRAVRAAIFPASDGTFRRVPITQIEPQLELAYATSVHKSQGSEFKHIAVVLPREDMALLTKQLLYTAITRASKSVTLVDPQALFSTGAARPLVRHTGLRERLAHHVEPAE